MHFGRTINKVLQTLPSPAESYNCLSLNHNSGFGFIPSFPLRYTQSHLERESRHLHHPNGPCFNSHRLSIVPVSISFPLLLFLSVSQSPPLSLLSVCLFQSPTLSFCLAVSLCLPVFLSVCLSLSVSPSFSVFLSLSVSPSVCLSVSISLPLFLSVCLSLQFNLVVLQAVLCVN